MLRTTENKIYRQGISDPKELENGFPVRPEELFAYQGIIMGSVEAGYFTPLQQELLREFVDRRGGGLLFLGGRFALGDGGWGGSSLVDLLPTILPNSRSTFHRDPANAELTAAGSDSPITRLMDDPAKNIDRWKKLTYLMDYQDAGTAKPGATVLAQMNVGSRKLPLLVTQNYGRGRTAIMATSGTWRWQMSQPLGDPAHDLFWQQLLRWLVLESPGQIVVSAPTQTLMDDGHIQISASVRDKEYMPAPDAKVTAHFIGPDGISAIVDMTPATDNPGVFRAAWTAEKPGSYLAEVTAQRGRQGVGRFGNGHASLPTNRWRCGKFPHHAKPRTAGEARIGNRWALLETGRADAAAERDLVFRRRHFCPRHQRIVEHAGGVPVAAAADGGGMAAAPQVGCGMRPALFGC